jgi:carbonic anhydrase
MEDGASAIVVEGKRYVLAQFHFHAPSEHTIDGRHADMEMHLVHKSEDGQVAVVGVMIRAGAENLAFAPIWDRLPTPANKERRATATIDAASLLPKDHGHYRYLGSFTTPPCTEGVLWLVLRTPVELSRAQIDQFRAVIEGNNRPVQPRNQRAIEYTR